jgi:hypothetical protein
MLHLFYRKRERKYKLTQEQVDHLQHDFFEAGREYERDLVERNKEMLRIASEKNIIKSRPLEKYDPADYSLRRN